MGGRHGAAGGARLADGAGAVTELGRIRHQGLEAATDLAAARVWEDYPRAELDLLAAALKPISALCRGALPVNPMGLPDKI